jgi:hypothetical protein
MPYVSVDVDVDLGDFDTDDLIRELDNRGHGYNTHGVDGDEAREFLQQVYQLRRSGQDYNSALDQLIYHVLGKIA